MSENRFPHIIHAVKDYLNDEEGNISRSKLLTVGSLMIIMSILLAGEAFAAHRSHSSHSSHKSHSSHSSHKSHSSHSSSAHSNHSSHSSHSNAHSSHASHDNVTVPSLNAPKNTDYALAIPKIENVVIPQVQASTGIISDLSSIGTIPPIPTIEGTSQIG